MHGLIRDRLEDYLGGVSRKLPVEFERHLQHCEECREELSWMQEQSRLLRALSPSREMEPAAGFYARVMDRIERQQANSLWAAFLDPVFGRRLSATAMAVVVLLFGYLAYSESRQSDEPAATQAAAMIMAPSEHPPLGVDRQRDRDIMLVTLATYSD